jgi:transcription antitermination factor NusG
MVRAGLREFYLPQVNSPRPSALFPGYVFIRPVDAWRPILSAAHVTGVIGIGRVGEKPYLVDDDVIEDIWSRERHGFIVLPEPFAPGQKVRVRFGHFLFGGEGICKGMSGSQRVDVLLTFLGGTKKVSLRKADLVPA